MDRTKALDKIKKLFALTSSPSEGEARNALLVAQKLMAKYGIEESEVSIEDNSDEVLEDEIETKTKGVSTNTSALVNALSKHYKCVCYLSRRYDGSVSLKIAGHPQDVEVFKEVALYAINVMEQLFKQFLKTKDSQSKSQSIKLKNTYCAGFTKGIVDALIENENKFALMVMPDNVVMEVLNGMRSTKSHKKMAADADAWMKGLSDGKESLKLRNAIA